MCHSFCRHYLGHENQTMKTDTELKLALAKMLPEKIESWNCGTCGYVFRWNDAANEVVLDTELLHVCWLAEQTIDLKDKWRWLSLIDGDYAEKSHATWQQRATALCKVKGVE